MYIADYGNHRIRKVSVSTDIITTIAGNGNTTFSGDGGAATSAGLSNPIGLALDTSGSVSLVIHRYRYILIALYTGNVYIADMSDNRIRKVTLSTGIITTIAGSSTSGSFSGDGGAATSAALSSPMGVAIDTSGRIALVTINIDTY